MAQTAQLNEMNLLIRPLNIEDENEINRVLDLAQKFHEESDYKHMVFSREKVKRLLVSLSKQDVGYVRMAEVDGVIEGGLVCMRCEPYYSEEPIVQDMGLFVNPDKRGARIAGQLVTDLMTWAAEVDAKEVWMGVTAGITDEAAGRLYEHFGFEGKGTIYRKVL